jgi:hypothetical protein
MAPPTTKADAVTSESNPQTINLTDRTASHKRDSSIQDSDSDPTSSSGSSSEDDSESENGDEEHSDRELNGAGDSTAQTKTDSSLPHIGGRPKPRICRMKGDSGILSRLNAFLPQMKSANEDLQKEIEAGRASDLILDNAEGNEGRYIEMVCLTMRC